MPKASKKHKPSNEQGADDKRNWYYLLAAAVLLLSVAAVRQHTLLMSPYGSDYPDNPVDTSRTISVIQKHTQLKPKDLPDTFGSSQFDEVQDDPTSDAEREAEQSLNMRFQQGSTVYARLKHKWAAATVLKNDNQKAAYRLGLTDGSDEEVYAHEDTDKYVRLELPIKSPGNKFRKKKKSKRGQQEMSADGSSPQDPASESENDSQSEFYKLVARGFKSMGKEDYKDARTVLREATNIIPDSGQAYFNLGTALHELANKADKEEEQELKTQALQAFLHAGNFISPEEGEQELQVTKVSALYNAGLLAAMMGEGARAKAMLVLAKKLDPANSGVQKLLQDVEQAIEDQ